MRRDRGTHDGAEPQAGLTDLFDYPLMSALVQRRTRRIARGTSIQSGKISHQSSNQPAPLSPVEEAILIMATGVTGIVMHDGPLQKPEGGHELGTPFLNVVGRAGSSPDNAQATHMFMLNDEGTWLIRRLQGREALQLLKETPPSWREWKESDWLAAADLVKRKVYPERLDFPRAWPYYLGWNKQISNRPGTTVFMPMVDLTRQYINAILIVCSEPEGLRPLFIDDFSPFRPKNATEWVAKVASALGLAEPIPYQPIGGLKWVRSGKVSKDNYVPLGYGNTLRTDHEAFFLLQNLMLVGEGLGIGGWVHGAIHPLYIMQRDVSKGWYGLGFRTLEPRKHRRWPPLPSPLPNWVGLDGHLEGLCPPYVKSMDEAVDKLLESKTGPEGAYTDKELFARPYAKPEHASEYLSLKEPHPADAIAYTKEICNYLWDTYGRFPAHVMAWYSPGIWVQFSHLENEYYEKYARPAHWSRQARHDQVWHQ